MNENNRIDNPQIKIVKCFGPKAQDEKMRWNITKTTMDVIFNKQKILHAYDYTHTSPGIENDYQFATHKRHESHKYSLECEYEKRKIFHASLEKVDFDINVFCLPQSWSQITAFNIGLNWIQTELSR